MGNIASASRARYAAVGGTVNLASRIEPLPAGGQILISEATRAEVGPELAVTASTQIAVKGFSEPVRVHWVEGLAGERMERPGGNPCA